MTIGTIILIVMLTFLIAPWIITALFDPQATAKWVYGKYMEWRNRK